jgi:hypothetical protein
MTMVNQFRGLGFQDPPQTIAPYVGATFDYKAAPESFYGQCLNVARRKSDDVKALNPLKDASMTQIMPGDLVFHPHRSKLDDVTAKRFATGGDDEEFVNKTVVECGRYLPDTLFSVFNGLPCDEDYNKMLSLYYANIFAGVSREGTPATTDATKPAQINVYSSTSILSYVNKLNVTIPNEALMTWAIFPSDDAEWSKKLMSDVVWEQRPVTKASFVPITVFTENEDDDRKYPIETMMQFVVGQNCGDVVLPGGRGLIRLL